MGVCTKRCVRRRAVLCCAVLCCAVLCCAVLGWAGLGWAGLGWAFAAPADAPPCRPPPLPLPLLRALLLWRRPPASSSAAAPDFDAETALSVRAALAGSEAGGLRRVRAGPQSRPKGPCCMEEARACWCETACGPSRAGCAAVIPRASSSGSAPACSSRTGIVRLPAQNEAGHRVLSMVVGAGRAVRLARTQLLVERVHHCDGRRVVRQAE